MVHMVRQNMIFIRLPMFTLDTLTHLRRLISNLLQRTDNESEDGMQKRAGGRWGLRDTALGHKKFRRVKHHGI